MPEEIIGVIPSSIRVPRLLASIIRNQYRGSDVSEETMPYSGIWLITRNIKRVRPVHIWPVLASVSSCADLRIFSYELLVERGFGLRGRNFWE